MIKDLIKLLNEASYAYYNTGSPIMSDSEYDKLYSELEKLEQQTEIIYANSPTQNVGSKAVDILEKVTHEFPMLSLAKCHTAEELRNFMGNQLCLLMLKMDGLTVRATYEGGELKRLETRGDGYVGNDVTHLIGNFVNLPFKISIPEKLIVDGECIISYGDFERINAKLPDDQGRYKNPRNLASGTLSAKNAEDVVGRPLRFIAWRVIKGMEDEDSLYRRMLYLDRMGFEVVTKIILDKYSSHGETLGIMLNDLREHAKVVGYPIDGVVLAIDSISAGYKLGSTAHHFNHSVAYKFEDDKYETRVIDVEWTGGKTGVLTPTLVFDPVLIDGTTVSRASMHNVSIMKQLHPTKGCTAYIYKANQIIPQCDSCEDDGIEEFLIPKKCPICGADTFTQKSNSTEVLLCSNENCRGKLLKRLCAFVGRQGFDIDGLSEATLEKFIELGWVNDYIDIFRLEKHYTDMIKLEGFGVRSAQKLLKGIDASRRITMDKFITSLSIPMVGSKVAKQIAEIYEYDWFAFKDDLEKGNRTKLNRVNGIGDIIISNIVNWHKQKLYNDEIEDIIIFRMPDISDVITRSNQMSGVSICVTGKLNRFKNREELAKVIESVGAKEVSGVTKKTSYLLTNDKDSGSSKNKKAADLGVSIISEDEFISMCGIEV